MPRTYYTSYSTALNLQDQKKKEHINYKIQQLITEEDLVFNIYFVNIWRELKGFSNTN